MLAKEVFSWVQKGGVASFFTYIMIGNLLSVQFF